ncbi:TRAP transporter small permease [Breoghania sp. L-A4]|nr:TRAP transporter small permease [Breoghania sp. L-A4]
MRTVLTRAVDRLIDLSAALGGVALVFVTLVILVDVVGRFFGTPLTGAQDISQMTLVIIVFAGMALCDRLGGHVAVDIFANAFSNRQNRWLDVFAQLTGAVIFAGIAWTVWESAKLSQMLHLSTNIIGLPKVYFQWTLAAFAALTSLGMLLRAIQTVLTPTTGRIDHQEEVL